MAKLDKPPLSFRVSAESHQIIEHAQQNYKGPKSQVVEMALSEFFDKHKNEWKPYVPPKTKSNEEA